MKIYECLLNDQNEFRVGDTTVGAMVALSGKKHLWEPRSRGAIDTIVIHYMSAVNVAPDDPYNLGLLLRIFCDYGVSSHYLISRRGTVYNLVPEEMKAWHCGGSIMPEPDNRTGVNEFSIGIELMATEKSGFTASQYEALRRLSSRIEARYGILPARVVGHDMIAGERAVAMGLRKEPKTDPGPLFDRKRFDERLRIDRWF